MTNIYSPKVALIDLDGTLTDTAAEAFKPYKDGLQAIALNAVPLITGAVEFIKQLRKLNVTPIIISDSHPRYVGPIAEGIFDVDWRALASKPNPEKTIKFLLERFTQYAPDFPHIDNDPNSFILIGDTWMDIEMGRCLRVPTVLTNFYKIAAQDFRDNIGNYEYHLKSGPTFTVKRFDAIIDLILDPESKLFAIESFFRGGYSTCAINLKTEMTPERFIAHRSLARQTNGECDIFQTTPKYNEFNRENRSAETMSIMANAISHYIESIITSNPSINWDCLTFVSDKSTTVPPNKLYALFNLIQSDIPKVPMILWSSETSGSIRNQPKKADRTKFCNDYILLDSNINVKEKNIIIIDDQYTTGATADAICDKLVQAGAGNLVFISLYNLVNTVKSRQACPNCGKQMVIKINRTDGSKFFSCVPPVYKGNGCGKNLPFNQS